MRGKKPFFSVVTPTRNRAILLRYSLQSALEQTFDDYEIVVSDNDSSDNTSQVVHELSNRHVRYVRTGKPLSHPDSLEFAADQAQGDYVVFLFDDDALCPEALETVSKFAHSPEAPVVKWEHGFYHHSGWHESERANTLEFSPFDRQMVQLNSRTILDATYMWKKTDEHAFPAVIDTAFPRDILKRVKERNSRLFHEFTVEDISLGIPILTQVEHILHLREILCLYGKHPDSVTCGLSRPNREQKLVADYATKEFQHVPLQSVTLLNFIFESLLKMKEIMPEELKDYNTNWAAYFIICQYNLTALRRQGADVSRELREFDTALDRQPLDVQRLVRAYIAQFAREEDRPWSRLKGLIQRSPLVEQLELMLRPGLRRSKNLVIRGEQAGFHNILECARFFNHSQREQLARFWAGRRYSLPVRARVLWTDPWQLV